MSEQHAHDGPPADEAGDRPTQVQDLEPTGEPDVDRILNAVRDVADLPLAEQVTAYESVQTGLRSLLDGPRQPAPPTPGTP